MIILPAIQGKTITRPGLYGLRRVHKVADPKQKKFWQDIYKTLSQSGLFDFPIKKIEDTINPYFGNFGTRWHPKLMQPNYFHIGVDIKDVLNTKIYPVTDGILEYSGFGFIDGKYVFLSHPEIKTEDGFVLYSLYMHLSDYKVKFTKYQKMLREVSLHNYPKVSIKKDKVIGLMGDSGDGAGYPHLHLQLEFRNQKGEIIAIDPSLIIGVNQNKNTTATIKSKKKFFEFAKENEEDLKKWRDGAVFIPK